MNRIQFQPIAAVIVALWVCLTLTTTRADGAEQQASSLRTIPLTLGNHKIVAEVAETDEQRMRGLMYRFSLRPDQGMIFVFAQPQQLGFWMKNTFVPLSIAFIDSQGRILNIEDMAPQTEATHPSRGLALYALEMRKGWFRDHGLQAGDRVEGLPPASKQ
jgi:uncharacterized membrane protein (UPF0127 family)